MPTLRLEAGYWAPDFELMRGFIGAAELDEWFGFTTDFHDSELIECRVKEGQARLVLAAFRITSRMDANGYYVLDKHAAVTLHLEGVSSCRVDDIPTTVLELGFRRCDGDLIELAYDDVCGGRGSIMARNVRIEFLPTELGE